MVPPPIFAEMIPAPGATISGFRPRPGNDGPREDHGVMTSLASAAPTVMLRRDAAGLPIVCPPGVLPAARQTTTPASTARSAAFDAGESALPPPPRLRFATST